MTYEIILSYTTEGVGIDLDADDVDLLDALHEDEEFQKLISDLSMRFSKVASSLDDTD